MMPFAGISEHQKTRNWNTAQQDKRIQKVSKSLGLFLGCLACLIARNSCQEPGSLDAWEAASFESEISSLEVQRISKVEDTWHIVTLFCQQLPAVASRRLPPIPMRPITNEPVEPDIEVLRNVFRNRKIVMHPRWNCSASKCFWGLLSCGKPSLL